MKVYQKKMLSQNETKTKLQDTSVADPVVCSPDTHFRTDTIIPQVAGMLEAESFSEYFL